jgi:hypothetical protein
MYPGSIGKSKTNQKNSDRKALFIDISDYNR